MLRLSVRKKLLISYLLIGFPLTIFVIYNSWHRYQATTPIPGSEINDVYFFILGLALTVAFSIVSGHFITQPITVLRQNFEHFANLNFSKLKPIKSGDEFELLFKKFNQMNLRLSNYTKSFETKNNELQAIINNMQSGVLISDAKGNIVTLNKTAQKIVKYNPEKNYKNRISYLYKLTGEAITTDDSPVHRTLNGEKFSNYLLEYCHPKTNKRTILNFNGTPLKDERHNIYGSVLLFLDVTKQYRLQERLRRMVSFEKIKSSHLSVLHDVSLKLNKEKDIGRILTTVTKAAATIAEAKSGMLLQQEGDGFTIASTYNFKAEDSDVSLAKIKKHLGPELIKKLFKDKKSLNIPDLTSANKGNDFVKSNRTIKAILVNPIIDNKQKVVGLLALFNKKHDDRRFTLEDEKVTQILSAHASVALSNAINYEREHRISQLLQKSMLPSKSFANSLDSHIDVSLAYKPATHGVMVGGDFYDFIDLGNNRTACIIADVNGKGIQAATITSLVRNTLKAFAYEGFAPDKVLEKTNKALYNQTGESVFITAVYGVIDLSNGHFIYANAGHHPPMLYREKQNEVTCLNEGSTPLGLLSSEQYELHRVELELNDSLVLYTDGLVEGRCKGQFFGEEGLVKSILSHAPMPVNIAEKILADVEHFTNNNLTDDIALLVLKVKQPFSKLVHRLAVKSKFVGW